MGNLIFDSLAGLPDFAVHFISAVIMTLLFCLIYLRITPYAEIQLIKEGKTAPAISFSGALLGFVIPLASAISHSTGLLDMILWAVIALVVQVIVFALLRSIFPGLIKDIPNDRVASAVILAVCSVAAGMLNAACMVV